MAWYNNILKSRKLQTKTIYAKQRSYSGASRDRFFTDFSSTSSSPDSEIQPNIRILRARARELARNDSYVSRYLNLMISNVVGKSGIRISSKARTDSGNLDMDANQQIEKAWKEWCKRGVCTVDGRMSFLDCQKLFIETLYRDGEVLILHRQVKDVNKFGYAIRFIEADRLDEDYNDIAANGNQIKMGVEVDSHDRPIAYYLFKDHPYDTLYSHKREHDRVPKEELMHIFLANRPEQTRGISPIATSMANIKMLNGYLEAEIVAARVGSSKMGFFTSPEGNSYVGDDTAEDGYAPVMNASAGTFEQLPSGMSFQSFDPSHPSTAFESFTKSVLRSIASGLNISYHSLSNDLTSVNYSSIRQGALEDRAAYQISQQFMIEHMIEPIFKQWFLMAIGSELKLPPEKFDKFFNSTNYIAREWDWIDPQKEINAKIAGLQNGITTYSDIASSQGRDAEELMEMHQKEKQLMEQYGIKSAYQPFGQKQPVPAEIDGSKDEE